MLRFLFFLCVYVVPCCAFDAVHNLTLDEKIGQILMVHFHGEVVNQEARELIQDVKVGGLIYYNWANGLHSFEQVCTLSNGLQELTKPLASPIPLFIAADQEGGIVARLKEGFTEFPGNRAIGETKDSSFAERAAYSMGLEMKAAGVNMNFSPVVDVNVNPKNPVIGIRAFGDDPEMVCEFGAKAVKGYTDAGVIATLKHFPGHGDVELDSHVDLPVIKKPMEDLEQVELMPFRQLAKIADVIMTAHILVPALDPVNCATLSEKTLSYLKNTIGFQGLIISDSLTMQGVLNQSSSIDEAAIAAFNAGCDILLIGGKLLVGNTMQEITARDIKCIKNSLVQAVVAGRIAESRVDEAVVKVLQLKEKYSCAPAPDLNVTFEEHDTVSRTIASRGLQVTGECVSLESKKIALFAPKVLKEAIAKTSFVKSDSSVEQYYFEEDVLVGQNDNADVLLIFAYNAWKNPQQKAYIDAVLHSGKPHILIVTRDPIDALLFPQAKMVVKTFSPTAVSLDAACDYIMNSMSRV